MNYKVITYFLYLFLTSLILAQERDIQFQHFTVDDGLSSNTVLCLLEDSRGFLWIGTYDGLNKYDGYKFTIYKNSPYDSLSISDNMIGALHEDKYGNIWAGCGWGGGLNKFNRDTEKFTRYLHDPENPSSISSDRIRSIDSDNTGNLWIGTEDAGLEYYELDKEIFHHFRHNPDDQFSLRSDLIYVVYVDNNNQLWVGTGNNGFHKFIKDKGFFVSYLPSDDPESISGKKIASISEDPFGYLWIGTEDGGLNMFDPYKNKFDRYTHDPKNINSLSDNYAWVVNADSEGMIWIGTYNSGLNLFDVKNNSFYNLRKNYNDPKSLSDDAVFTIYEDHSGIMWFGTWSAGLNKYDRKKEKFTTYSYNPNNPNSLSGNRVFAIYKDTQDELWVGTESGGLTRIDEKNNKFAWYQYNPNDPGSLSSNVVYSICEDKDGYLWIGTYAGISKFNRKTNKFQRFVQDSQDQNSLGKNIISQLFCDSYGDLWIGLSSNELDRKKRGENKFIHYKNDPSNPKSVSSQMVYIFYEDKSRNLWMGTHVDGLMLYNRKTDDFTFFRQDPNNPANSISHNAVSALCEDEKGILWIGTNGAGFNSFDKLKNKFKNYTEKDGLSNNVVNGILSDDNGNLWISTGKGISKFNIKNESFTNYISKDGLQGSDFNGRACYKSRDGEMYFGGTNGLNRFRPDKIKENPHIPPIVLSGFQILHKPVQIGFDTLRGRTILEKAISEIDLLELNHDDNIISFEFAALDFHSPEKNKYAYILEGFDNHWTQTDASQREITYTNLDPGKYTLKVKGSNNDGVWNEAGLSLQIIINPPWWSRWWAYMIYGFIIALVFTVSTRIYLNRQKLKTQLALERDHAFKLEEVDKMKSNFYANISHEFRTPLMLILGPAEKLISRIKDEDGQKQVGLIKGNARRLLTLINQLLDLARLEAGRLKLNAALGNIAQFVKGLAMEFESIAEQKDISLKIIMEKEDIEAYFDREKMEKIIINLLSNSFKFTPAGGRITVSLNEMQTNRLEIVVRDSGIGIPKTEMTKIFDRFYQVDNSHTREHEGTGIGLALTKELVELHKGSIFIDSVEGHWTEVKVNLPIGREHLSDSEIIEPSEYQLRKVESLEEEITTDLETDDALNEHLIEKTIVLVVEDNTDVREYIRDALKGIYHVEEAANGEQGLRKAEKIIPDLIISDIMMPKMDGYELTKKLRQDERTSHVPIILLTAKSDKDSKLEGLGLGADDYLTKPFDSDELLARIKNLIETRKMLQEKFGAGASVLHKEERPKLSCLDEQFLNRILVVIEEHIAEEDFSIEEFGKDVGMSRSQIHRKLKALTGKSTSLYLRTVRLAKAKQMIEAKKGNISEISYQVGFSSPAYFSRCFKEEFGYSPSEVN